MPRRTSEEVEHDRQINKIFSPHADEQMQAYFRSQPEPTHVRFVHYTSADAALNIIRSKRVWMRNVTSMADFGEVQHGYRLLTDTFKANDNGKIFEDALDSCFPGATAQAFEIFNSWWNDISLNTYVTSISEHDKREDLHGRLSMWRAFGADGSPRVAIVVKIPINVVHAGVFNLVFSPVAYFDEREIKHHFTRVVESIRSDQDFLKAIGRERVVHAAFNMLVAGVTCQKHEGFQEEREWRLVYAPKRWPSPLIESCTKVIGGIPQIIYKIPYDARVEGVPNDFDLAKLIDRIIIGPSIYPWSMIEAFVEALKTAGVESVEGRVFASGIPVRL